MAKVNDIKNATRKLDSELLTRLIKETTTVTDRTGQRAIYYIPSDEKFTDVCQYTFAKYGIPMNKYKSSINPRLQDRLEQIMAEMGQKSK